MHSTSRPYRYQRIGAALREIREAREMTQDAAGRLLERSAPSLSSIENGQQAIRRRDLMFILDQYGITDPDVRGPLLALASQGRQKGLVAHLRATTEPVHAGLRLTRGRRHRHRLLRTAPDPRTAADAGVRPRGH